MVRKKNKMFVDSADRTPHYSLRKLSVGVASVLLSTTLWMGANGSVARADTNNNATVAEKVEDKLDPSETHKDQTQAQTAESTSQASVASAEKQNGEAQKGQAQVAVANANQAEKKQAQKVDSANAEAQTPTANDAHAQVDVAKQELAAQSQQTAPQAQVPASAERQASTTLDVRQAFEMPINKKMVMASLARPNMASSISELEKANEDTTAVPGFSVTDPDYPSEMYRDPDPEHYTFYWVGQKDNGYQTVISTNRNGDGQIHVFELDQSNGFIYEFDLDKNHSHWSRRTGLTYYNDKYAGLVQAGSSGGLTLKYEVSGGKTDQPVNSISFIVPRLNKQVTSYHDESGNDIIDKNGEKIEPVVQSGLDGQKYTTAGTKVIDGYYAKAPSNAQGTMSPYGKIDSTYEINMHNGYSAVFTQIDNDGTMSAQMYYEDRYGDRFLATRQPKTIKPGDTDIPSGVDGIYLRSIYVPQTIDIKYVYKKLGNTVLVDEDNKPFMGNTPTQYPNDPNDPTKAGKVVIPQYKGYTPKINGVPVGPDGFIPTDPGEDTKVVYTPDAQKAKVVYFDKTTGKNLKTDEFDGKTHADSGYNTKQTIDGYKSLGYALVSDSTEGKNVVFDDKDDDKVDQINPGEGSSGYPKGATPEALQHDVNRTINYVVVGGNDPAPASVHDKLHFEASALIDKVTGEVTKTTWDTAKNFNDVESTPIKGYTVDPAVVSNKDVAHDAKDIVETVKYTANDQKAKVVYFDKTTGKTLKTDKLDGKTHADSGYNTQQKIDGYKSLGYALVSDSTEGKNVVFDDKDDDKVDHHFIHDTITVDPENPGKQTVTYVYKDKDGKVVKTKKDEQDTTFTGNTTKDEVTGETTTTWEQKNHTYKPVNTPVEPGYTATPLSTLKTAASYR